MFKSLLVLFVFCLIVFTIGQSKSVKEIKKINELTCKDICK